MAIGIYPNCDCCGNENDCTICTGGTPTSIFVSFDTVPDNACGNCTNYEITSYELFHTVGCNWSGDGESCDGVPHNITLSLVESGGGGTYRWELTILNTVTATIDGYFVGDDGFTATKNCSATQTLSYDATFANDVDCDWSGATATIN